MVKKVDKKPKPTKKPTEAEIAEALGQYEKVFGEINRFTEIIREQEKEMETAAVRVEETRTKYNEAKLHLEELRQFRDGAKHSLYKFLAPGVTEIMPLFDTMEPADDEKHGSGSAEWRKDPLSVLKLSLPSINILNEADILFVGQLQDRVQDDADSWWESIAGMTAPVAAAIVDRLNEFLFKNEKRKK